jgi:hypothetical protein
VYECEYEIQKGLFGQAIFLEHTFSVSTPQYPHKIQATEHPLWIFFFDDDSC